MELILPKLQPWQKEVHDKMKDSLGTSNIYVVKAKRQIGKSILAIMELICFSCAKKTVNVVLEPTLNQSRRIFKQIVDLLEPTKLIKSSNGTLLTIEFINGSEIIFKSAEQREALRGFTVTGLLVIDEAASIPDSIFEIVFPTTDANKAPILIISTPLFEDGLFYDLYIKGLEEDGNNKRIYSFDWNKYDTSVYLTPQNLEMYRQTLTANKFRSEYLGEFITDGSYVFGNIKQCIGTPISDKPIYGGIDWAIGNDGDDTVVTLMNADHEVVDILVLNKLQPTQQVEQIRAFLNKYPSVKKLQVEMNSIGSVYCDMLKNTVTGIEIIEFNTVNESKRRIIEQLIKAFEDRSITIPNNEKLKIELQHYEQQKLSKGYTYNASNGFHDDMVISLALCYDLTLSRNNYAVSFNNNKKHKTIRELYGIKHS